ncbi:hypothetical protein C1646_669135 [Rhizophagus diaphanus]|nr:hypothetical protein C1646_669135 [Rhizophagus diaphanus] [Rhizophagus sp. MUCL 43196]
MVLVVQYSGIRSYKGNLKNVNDMHLCKVRVILGWQLSWTTPLKITIQGYVPHNFPINKHEVTRNNLDYQIRDMVFKDIVLIIIPQKYALMTSLITRDDKRLKDNGDLGMTNFAYENPDEPENSPAKYYQLTVSDEFWLCNGRDFGKICIGLDAIQEAGGNVEYDQLIIAVNIITGESCLDYTWNGSFHDEIFAPEIAILENIDGNISLKTAWQL